MKDINIYLYESLENERIDEGFKDFIRKFALTTAIATSCLNAAAKPIQHVDDVKINKQIVQDEKFLLKYGKIDNKDDINLIIKSGHNRTVVSEKARLEFINKTKGKGHILKTGFYENDEGEYTIVLFYIMK